MHLVRELPAGHTHADVDAVVGQIVVSTPQVQLVPVREEEVAVAPADGEEEV
jgi:hypothetical protein